MDESLVFLTLLGMGAVTYIPRLLPMLLLSGKNLAPWIARWLSFVPATVLAALLAPGLVCSEGRLDVSVQNIYLLAAIPTFFVAWRFKSFFGTVATGMVLVALVRYIT
ncbi:AzlD domain-containing protein [Desulfosediminicola flagellatus]|uniref:AzlD domain-containing protein n=1 Tax=Desulfosediminicola flagellatus TaxID=2569541 RepID=UPI0010ABABEA|nr:AzlD domain-containing protein [Desulfosediminicola flagellatus]